VGKAAEELLRFADLAESFETMSKTGAAAAFEGVSTLFAKFEAHMKNSADCNPAIASGLHVSRHLLAGLCGAMTAQQNRDNSAHDLWWQVSGQFWKLFSSVETSESRTATVEAQFPVASIDCESSFGDTLSALAPEWDDLDSWVATQFNKRKSVPPLQPGRAHPPALLNAAGLALNRVVVCSLLRKGGLAHAASCAKVFAQLLLMNDSIPVEIPVDLLNGASAALSMTVDKQLPKAINDRLKAEALSAQVVASRLRVFPVCNPQVTGEL
jgi:hypothetical protein